MILDELIDDIKLTAKDILSIGEPFYPMLNTIKDGREQVVIVAPPFEEEEKENVYTQMMVAANLYEPEIIVFTSDTMVLRVDEGQNYDGVNPVDSPFSQNALMMLIVTPDEKRTILCLYSINDDGSIVYGEEEDITNSPTTGWLTDLMEAALVLDKDGVEDGFEERLIYFMIGKGFDIVRLW